MKESQMATELYCIRCLSDTPHNITYLNGQISHIECTRCSRSYDLQIDVKHELYHELLDRVRTKPARITKEYKENLSRFLQKFPRRVVKKPFRLYKEVKEMKQLLTKYSSSKK
ncbi:hypothetical protein SAMN05444392_103158 [Seinonella peptonophila]|uniref:Bh protein n=1 Tax=Seinonella peptonophila TaxID=112248 RepID=A0A1M4WCP3_9BACL|nr:bh protein [Seinonella peptonophila]SHE79051.1 hypothetical protein SAMN05444392_103158 [Seinonella peptonophila]